MTAAAPAVMSAPPVLTGVATTNAAAVNTHATAAASTAATPATAAASAATAAAAAPAVAKRKLPRNVWLVVQSSASVAAGKWYVH